MGGEFQVHQERLPDDGSSHAWIPQRDIREWIATELVSLAAEDVHIDRAKVAEIQQSIPQHPTGLSTVIEWQTGKLELLTRRQGQVWQTVLRKVSQSRITASYMSSRSERWANVSNLSGWLKRQAEKLQRYDFDFTDDDVEHLESAIRGSPSGLSTTVEWTTGKWQLMIRQHGEIWQAITAIEDKSIGSAPLKQALLDRTDTVTPAPAQETNVVQPLSCADPARTLVTVI